MSIKKLALLLAVIAATAAGAATAHAQNARTWVSGIGTDTDNTACSRSAPCLTFAHAIAETANGGEISCLDPGAFGAVTISISVTINCEGSSNGSTTAITINNGNAFVNLIGLEINAGSSPGGNGVAITAPATVTIRNCKIYNYDTAGISFQPGSSGGFLLVDNVYISLASIGISQSSSNGAVVNMSVRNSTIANQNAGILVSVSGSGHAGATIEQTTIAATGTALQVSGAHAVALIGGSTIVNNVTGVSATNGSIVYSFKNNQIGGNGTDGTPLTAYPGGPLN
jgi:hypothetical protein